MTESVPAEIASVLAAFDGPNPPERIAVRTAVKAALTTLATAAPGHSVEVRVPPHAAVQCIPGVRHRRGTPPAVVETDARTWLDLVTGRVAWPDAVAAGRVVASGARSDLSHYLPLYEAN
jgi:hypothetical protein